MSDAPEEFDLLAGEYVLGCLEEAEMRAVEARAAADPALRAAIAAWERRLAPLAGAVAPVTAPPELWARLQASLDAASPRAPGRASVMRNAWRSTTLWRGATAASLALAAALAGVLIARPPAAPDYLAVLAQTDGTAPFVTEARRDGSLVVRALASVQVPGGKDLELWALPAGAQRPVSLGVLPARGTRLTTRLPQSGTKLLVSLEPAGGSPSGQPTGPVLWSGTLLRVD